ncbi:MAG: alpha-1,2-fucosyltransferase, partial [Daejeonella sp.]
NKDKIFFFPNPHHAITLIKYFDLGPWHNLTLGSKIYSIYTRTLPRILRFKKIFIKSMTVPKNMEVTDASIYSGYYQTDWYLKNLPYKLNLKIRKKYMNRFRALYGDLFSKERTLVVHIRRTDYLNYGKRDISLPIEYFTERLKAIEDIDSYKVFFLSDDMDYVRSVFEPKPNYIFSDNDDITDFQIIQSADIAIISNSSFAWWAAYLSEKNNTVYAPKNWIGFRLGKEFPKGIMTEKFIWCDVLS